MTVSIVQTCDVCQKKRKLPLPPHRRARSLTTLLMLDGWRSVQETQHICPDCIVTFLEK